MDLRVYNARAFVMALLECLTESRTDSTSMKEAFWRTEGG